MDFHDTAYYCYKRYLVASTYSKVDRRRQLEGTQLCVYAELLIQLQILQTLHTCTVVYFINIPSIGSEQASSWICFVQTLPSRLVSV